MTKWPVKLSEFDLKFEPRKALKVQVFADFLAELTPGGKEPCTTWTVYTNGSSNNR
ncbi:hypothetical protein A2U01_0099660 [Trifolium medium]|uniref:Uncharacterized protein n=1 Tax=Trifolium medium TaxID=97028 RepID=A0A392UW31_9FABA|nr:hypothetical protein [Trifolium medium]